MFGWLFKKKKYDTQAPSFSIEIIDDSIYIRFSCKDKLLQHKDSIVAMLQSLITGKYNKMLLQSIFVSLQYNKKPQSEHTVLQQIINKWANVIQNESNTSNVENVIVKAGDVLVSKNNQG